MARVEDSPRRPAMLRWILAAAAIAVIVVAIAVAYRGSGRAERPAPENPDAVAARAAFKSGDYPTARSSVDRWLAAKPDAAEAYYVKARLQIAADDPEGAFESLKRAVQLGYAQPPLAALRAVLIARAGDHDQAEATLADALRTSDAPQPEAADALTKIHLARFRIPEAAKTVARYIKDAPPNDPRPFLLANEVERQLGSGHAVLIANFRKALERDPANLDARLGLARELQADYKLDEAEKEFRAYRSSRPDDPASWVGTGTIASARNDLDTARHDLDHALTLDPKQPEALKARGLIALRDRDFAAVRSYLERELEIVPHDYESRFTLARALNELGERDEAGRQLALARKYENDFKSLQSIHAALAADPTNRDLRFQAAKRLFSQGQDDEATRWAELILRANPSDAETHRLLAEHYRKVGDPGKANYHELLSSPK